MAAFTAAEILKTGKHVKKPSQYRFEETTNLLDLILTNEEGMIPLVEHKCLVFDLKCCKLVYNSPTVDYNYYKVNYTDVSKFISDTEWDSLLNCDLKETYTKFIVM